MKLYNILLAFLLIFNVSLFGQHNNKQDELEIQITSIDSVLVKFYTSLMLYMSKELENVFKEEEIHLDSTAIYDYDSLELNALMVSGKSLFLIYDGEGSNIFHNLINNGRKKRIRHLLFLGTIAEQKKMPYDEIKVLNLSFNAVKNDRYLFHADYTIKIENCNFKISNKKIHF